MEEPKIDPHSRLMHFLGILERLPRPVLTALGLLLIYLIGYGDYRTGIDISPQVFYLIPVGIVAWCAGRGPGCILAINTTLARLVADYLTIRGSALTGVPQWNAGSHCVVALVFAWGLASLRARLDQEALLSRTDALTQVHNFRSFIEHASVEIERAARRQHRFAVAYMDCDNFKQVNDELGHTTGDALLRTVAQTMKSSVRPFDTVARLGGDEFAILLPEVTPEQTQVVVRRVRDRLTETMQDKKWPVTFSMGAVTFNKPPQTVTEMLRIADDVMYRAKHGGKNQVVNEVFNGALSPAIKAVEQQINKAPETPSTAPVNPGSAELPITATSSR